MISAYLVGLPGAGKSTLMAALTAGLDVAWDRQPFAHATYWRGPDLIGAQLGNHHPDFPGTDRLSMGVQPKAIAAVALAPWPVCVAEGDRLATAGFLDALAAASDRFDLVLLDTPPAAAADRRAERAASAPSPTWIKGRASKVANLIASRPHVTLDGTRPIDELVTVARSQVPAFAALVDTLS